MLYKIVNINELVAVDRGSLYTMVNGKLAPTKLMLDNMKKANFVTCSSEELSYWVEVAYSDKPMPMESADDVAPLKVVNG